MISNIIRNNTAGYVGGAVYDNLRAELRNNLISANDAGVSGGGCFGVRVFNYNLVVNNLSGSPGGGIWNGLDVRNNTFVGNSTGIFDCAVVSHNIVVRSQFQGITCSHCVLECNDIWGNGSDVIDGFNNTERLNFSADPLFCDERNGNYHLDRW